MRWLVWALLIFGMAVGIAVVSRFSNGNVAILWPPYRIDFSVNLALTLITIGFVTLHLLLLGLYKLFNLSQRVQVYKTSRDREKAQASLADSLLAFFEGRYGRAERLAKKAQATPSTASLAALIGARAAHRMKEFARRDEWLAATTAPQAMSAKLMTHAELLVEEQKGSDALVLIDQAQRSGARHIHALRIALRAYEQDQRWQDVLRVTRMLDKRDALHSVVSQQYRLNAYRHLSLLGDASSLNKLWQEVRSQGDIRQRLAGTFAERFVANGQSAGARVIYEQELADSFNAAFLRRYIDLNDDASLPARLAAVESLQRRYGDEPELLAALGELCRREKLWGKAQAYLQSSIIKRATVAAHISLAQLHEALDKPDQAHAQYKLAASLAMTVTSGLNAQGQTNLPVRDSNSF